MAFSKIDICNKIEKDSKPTDDQWTSSRNLVNKLMEISNNKSVTLSNKKVLYKSIYKLILHRPRCNNQVFEASHSSNSQAICLNGAILSGFYQLYNQVDDLCEMAYENFHLLNILSHEYSKYFNIILENLINLQKIQFYAKYFDDKLENIWKICLMNLESPYKGHRDYCLAVIKNLVNEQKFVENVIIPEINNWSWTNRNKFFILGFILSLYNIEKIEKMMNKQFFLYDVLEMSLKYKHLYAGSQSIVKVLVNQNDEQFFDFLAKLIDKCGEDDLKVLMEQWLTNLRQNLTKCLYKRFDDLSDNNQPNLQFAFKINFFKREIIKHEKLEILIDKMTEIMECDQNLFVKGQIFEAIVYITLNLNVQNSQLLEKCQENVRKMFLVNYTTELSTFRSQIVTETMKILNSEYLEVISHDFIGQLLTENNLSYQKMAVLSKLHQNSLKNDEILKKMFESGFDDIKNTISKLKFGQSVNYCNTFDDLNEYFQIFEDKKHLEMLPEKWMTLMNKIQIFLKISSNKIFSIFHSESQSLRVIGQTIDQMTQIAFGFGTNSDQLRVFLPHFNKSIILVYQMAIFVIKAMNLAKKDQNQVGTSFEILGDSLQMIVEKVGVELEDQVEKKKVILQVLWQNLRSLSQFSGLFAQNVIASYRKNFSNVFLLNICIKINILIGCCCCHKGAIEFAGQTIGKIYREISSLKEKFVLKTKQKDKEAEQIVEMSDLMFKSLLKLPMNDQDFRSCRGFLLSIHNIIKNDANTNETSKYFQIYLDEMGLKFDKDAQFSVLNLHQLNLLARESSLTEMMLEYVDKLLIISLENFKSTNWATKNAALQLFSSIIQKLVGQKQQHRDKACEWEPVYVTINEIIHKLPFFNDYILTELKQKYCSTSFLILVFEFLSKLKYRPYGITEIGQIEIINEYRMIFINFLNHKNEKVRTLTAKSLAQFHHFQGEVPLVTEFLIKTMFKCKKDENFKHGACMAIGFLVKKLISCHRFMGKLCERDEYMMKFRKLINIYAVEDKSEKSSYFYRLKLIDLLVYLGIRFEDEIFQNLIVQKTSENMFCVYLFEKKIEKLLRNDYSVKVDYEILMMNGEVDDDDDD